MVATTASLRYVAGAREPVRLVTTAAIPLTDINGVNYLAGLPIVDGVQTEGGDRILVKDQGTLNGIWVASAGKWSRAGDANDPRTLNRGILIPVQEGDDHGGTYWRVETLEPVIGVDTITFTEYLSPTLVDDMNGVLEDAEAARDAAQTAQTGAETARTGAETARTGAETARTGAETAQTGAQTARTGAEAAQGAAEGAAGTAGAAAIPAGTAQVGAETARTGAETARGGAETAQSAAETAAAAAGNKLPKDGTEPMTAALPLTVLSETPATPPAGQKKFYPKDDGGLYTLNSSGVETEVGAGGGGLIVPDSNAWMDGKSAAIISRGIPLFLMPEMYIGLETQIIYADADNPTDYTGATDFAPAIAAMQAEALTLLGDEEWFPTTFKRHKFGLAFQPGQRYAFDSGAKLTDIRSMGLVIEGNGATLCGRYAGGGPLLDLVNSHGINVRNLNGESNNDAQPSFGIALGCGSIITGDYPTAADIHFDSCRWAGWFEHATFYNVGSEVFRFIGGELMQFADAPAVWIDSRNRLDLGTFTQSDHYTLPANTSVSSISHWFYGTNIRHITGHEDGALKITSSVHESDLLKVRGVYVDAYVTNNAAPGNTDRRPGVYIEGPVDGFHFNSHAELSVPDSTVHLSHLVWYQRVNTFNPLTQWDHRITDYFADAEQYMLGTNAGAELFYLEDCHIKIGYSRGQYPAGTVAKLFDPNFSTCRWAGSLSFRGTHPTGFMNMNVLAFCDIDYYGGSAEPNIAIPPGSRMNQKTSFAASKGGRRGAVLEVTANGTIDPAGHDTIRTSGAVTAITISPTVSGSVGNNSRKFTVINSGAGAVTVNGLVSAGVSVAVGRSLEITQYQSSFFANV